MSSRTKTVETTRQFTSDAPGIRWQQAVLEHLKAQPGEELSVRAIVTAVPAADYGTRETSAVASLSTRWIYALPGDPWLHVYRRAEGRTFRYRWEPEARPPEKSEPAATVKRRSKLEGTRKPRQFRTRVVPEKADPGELEWAETHRDSLDPTARKVAADILRAHAAATTPRSTEGMSQRLRYTIATLGRHNAKEMDRLRKRALRLQGRGLDDDAVAEILPHVAPWTQGPWRSWINAEDLDLDQVFPPAPPIDALLDKVDNLREIVGTEPNHVSTGLIEEPVLTFLPETEEEPPEPVPVEVPRHEGFRLGEKAEIIGFNRDGTPMVRDTEGYVYKIVEVD